MWIKIKFFIYGLLYENNEPSLTRCIVLSAFLVFVAGTIVDIVMAIFGKVWQSYQTFATVTGGGSIGAKLADKVSNTIINGVWNSPPGQLPVAVKNPPPPVNEGNGQTKHASAARTGYGAGLKPPGEPTAQ